MIASVFKATLFIVVAAFLQTTVLYQIMPYHIVPDISLIFLVYFAYRNGMRHGEITGFVSGIFLDLISEAPLGLNALVRTVIGALSGLLKGNFLLGAVLLPALLIALAGLVKIALVVLLGLVFKGVVLSYSFSSARTWAELGLTAFFGPIVFFLFNLFFKHKDKKRKGFGVR
jgi:rod shape-determining protein MreD